MTSPMISVKFSYNWNNKLNNIVFTTIRKSNIMYKVGNTYNLYLSAAYIGQGEILEKITKKCIDVPDFIYWQDTGFSKGETMRIIQRLYNVPASSIEEFIVDVIFIKNLSKSNQKGGNII